MAKQLITTMEGELDLSEYSDEYRERVLEFVKAKAAGKVVRLPKARAKEADHALTAALKRSLSEAGREKKSA